MQSSAEGPLSGRTAKGMRGREATGVRAQTPANAWSGRTPGSEQCTDDQVPTAKNQQTRNGRPQRAVVKIVGVGGSNKETASSAGGDDSGAGGGGASSGGESTVRARVLYRGYHSKSASKTPATVEKADSSTDSIVGARPVRRHVRIHIITDEERALNYRADHLAAGISVPRAWQASQTLQKAQRQNRAHERQLADQLASYDRSLVEQCNRITNSERLLLNEFLTKYPHMYGHVMAAFRDDKATMRRIGIFPPSRTRVGSIPPTMSAADLQAAEAAVIRASLRTPGGGEFPPLVKRRVQVTAPGGYTGRRKRAPQGARAKSTAISGIQLNGVRCEEKRAEENGVGDGTGNKATEEEEEKPPPRSSTDPTLTAFAGTRTPTFIHTPGGSVVRESPAHKHATQGGESSGGGMNVTVFVDTDFGFNPERVRQTVAGMSLQKDIRDAGQLRRDMEQVARKHIDALTTPGLNGRTSRKTEGAQNLRSVIVGGKRGRERQSASSNRGTPSIRDDVSVAGSTTSSRPAVASAAKIIITPRRPKLKSRGALPPLDGDISKISVVGKADGPLVSQVNQALAQTPGLDQYIN